jgi:NAD(P) transhydrogenase subunit alpha
LLYAKNLYAFLETMVGKEKKSFAIDPEEELAKATLLTHGGQVVHANFKVGAAAAAKPAARKAAPKPAAKAPASAAAKAKPARKAPARKLAAAKGAKS